MKPMKPISVDAKVNMNCGTLIRCDKCRWHYEHGRDIVCAISKDVVRSNDYCSYWERKSDDKKAD